MLRVLHTSDWHLGHVLHDVARTEEHAAFLAWLLATLEAEQVDALLVAGDVFDTANPPADAQHALYRFVASAKLRAPRLDIVIIGGNHDSATRLEAPDPILRELGVRIVGGLPRTRGALDFERLLVPLHDRSGRRAAWVAAVPFLRPADLPPLAVSPESDPLVEGVRQLYAEVFEEVRRRREPDQAMVAMGHCYMTGTRLSELSERKILGGNQHALPVDLFPQDLAYVALGHLHRPQRVGGQERVRYSGSPLPLAMDEAVHGQHVAIAEFDGPHLAAVRELRVPRAVPFVRVPASGALAPDDLLVALAALPEREPELDAWRRPYLELHVVLERPDPALRQRIDEALQGKAARLLSLRRETTGTGQTLGDRPHTVSLDELSPEQVFRQCYARSYGGEPDAELLAGFAELLEAAQAQGGAR